ncbi:MAG TPA: transposase, partial [Patescibacteria group bacterium]
LAGQWNKGMIATKESLKSIQARCPFDLKGFDFDSGTEFINDQVVVWCINQTIQTTRTRPYRKNDHGRIEQKNYTNIRHFVGYLRYDQPEQVKILNQLYPILEDYLNFFVPSMKCLSKERIGSKYIRKYDTAQTAYQRVLNHPGIAEDVKQQLKLKYVTLNPKQLKHRIEQLQQKLKMTARRKELTYQLQ